MTVFRYSLPLEADDEVSARRLSLAPRRSLQRILWWWGAVFTAVCAWLTWFGWVRGRWHPLLLPLFGAGLFLAFYLFVVLPRSTRRNFQAQLAEGEITEQGFTAAATGTVPWARLHHWRHNRRVILLYVTDDLFTIVPLRAFPAGERAAVLSFLTRQVGPPHA